MKAPSRLQSRKSFTPLHLFLVIAILGFGLRLAYGIARYRGDLLHLSGQTFITKWNNDGLEHVLIAKALLSGEGYIVDNYPLPPGKHIRYAGQAALFKAPLYQFFLAGVFAVSGFSFKFFFPLQALLGSLASGLLSLIALETFKRTSAAFIAGIAAVAHPILVNSASQPYNENLFFFLFLAAIWAFLMWFRTRQIKWTLVCGAMVGLCTLTRESGLPLLAAMAAVGILSAPRDFKSWLGCGTIALTAFAVIAPWTLHNYLRYHAFVPVAAIVGEDLGTGNNECVAKESLFTSYWAEGPCIPFNHQIEAARALTPLTNLPAAVQFDRLSRRVTLDFIRAHPLDYVKLAIRRLWTCLLPYAPRGNQHPQERIVLAMYWLAIFPAGTVGLIFWLKRTTPQTGLLALIIALNLFSIMAVLYWSDLRFRVGIDLLMGCFAGWTYSQLCRRDFTAT